MFARMAQNGGDVGTHEILACPRPDGRRGGSSRRRGQSYLGYLAAGSHGEPAKNSRSWVGRAQRTGSFSRLPSKYFSTKWRRMTSVVCLQVLNLWP